MDRLAEEAGEGTSSSNKAGKTHLGKCVAGEETNLEMHMLFGLDSNVTPDLWPTSLEIHMLSGLDRNVTPTVIQSGHLSMNNIAMLLHPPPAKYSSVGLHELQAETDQENGWFMQDSGD